MIFFLTLSVNVQNGFIYYIFTYFNLKMQMKGLTPLIIRGNKFNGLCLNHENTLSGICDTNKDVNPRTAGPFVFICSCCVLQPTWTTFGSPPTAQPWSSDACRRHSAVSTFPVYTDLYGAPSPLFHHDCFSCEYEWNHNLSGSSSTLFSPYYWHCLMVQSIRCGVHLGLASSVFLVPSVHLCFIDL